MLQFVSKFGSGPFLPDLVEFHSEHVNPKFSTAPSFWTALSQLRFDCGWVAMAFAKENWASDKASDGMCKGVAPQVVTTIASESD